MIAAGSQANFFGVPGRPSTPSRCTRCATPIDFGGTFGIGSASCAPPDSDDALNVVICGGGPTGVEIAGALAELFQALRDEGKLVGRATVRLVDHGQALLAPFSDRSHRYALERLTEMGSR